MDPRFPHQLPWRSDIHRNRNQDRHLARGSLVSKRAARRGTFRRDLKRVGGSAERLGAARPPDRWAYQEGVWKRSWPRTSRGASARSRSTTQSGAAAGRRRASVAGAAGQINFTPSKPTRANQLGGRPPDQALPHFQPGLGGGLRLPELGRGLRLKKRLDRAESPNPDWLTTSLTTGTF